MTAAIVSTRAVNSCRNFPFVFVVYATSCGISSWSRAGFLFCLLKTRQNSAEVNMGRQRARTSDTPAKNLNLNPTSTFAYGILGATSACSLYWINDKDCRLYSVAMYTFLLCHAFVALVRYGHPDSGKKIGSIYETSALIGQYIILPLVNMDAYGAAKMPQQVIYIYIATIVLPVVTHFLCEGINAVLVDVCALVNIVSCLYLGYLEENSWVMGLAVVAGLNHFIYTRIAYHVTAPKQDLLAVALSFFNMFSIQALNSIPCKEPMQALVKEK